MEKWKKIENLDALYYISDEGRIKNAQGKILKTSDNGVGYAFVRIRVDGNPRKFYIHRLVAQAFLKKPDGCDVVNHKDFNPKNNCVSNLEWTTDRENYNYSFVRGRYRRTSEWKQHLKSTLDRKMGKSVIGKDIATGRIVRYTALNDCRRDGFQPSCVSNCCNGKATAHKGFRWEFA